MTYEFAKYPDGTLGVFSNIGKKENGEEYIRITFERPKEYGFDTYVIELPSYEVVFEDGNLPEIKDALEVENNGKRCVMEVSHHLGNNMVRCIMLSASEGLQRDREVIATGSGIKVPVGDKTLGRLFNVLGDTVDDGPSLEGEQKWVIHRDPPDFEHQKPAVEILETGIKVIDLLAPQSMADIPFSPVLENVPVKVTTYGQK